MCLITKENKGKNRAKNWPTKFTLHDKNISPSIDSHYRAVLHRGYRKSRIRSGSIKKFYFTDPLQNSILEGFRHLYRTKNWHKFYTARQNCENRKTRYATLRSLEKKCTLNVSCAICVRVLERSWIHLIHNCILPPFWILRIHRWCHQKGQNYNFLHLNL